MFHEHGNDDVDEDELCNEDEYDEVDGSNERIHTTVVVAIIRVITVVAKCVLNQPQLRSPALPRSLTGLSII